MQRDHDRVVIAQAAADEDDSRTLAERDAEQGRRYEQLAVCRVEPRRPPLEELAIDHAADDHAVAEAAPHVEQQARDGAMITFAALRVPGMRTPVSAK